MRWDAELEDEMNRHQPGHRLGVYKQPLIYRPTLRDRWRAWWARWRR
jgi:hypothetical protein